jgi:repressor LexA
MTTMTRAPRPANPGRPPAASAHKPTAAQREVLLIIRQFFREHSFPPTRREIGDALGVSSTNAVENHIYALERKGMLTRTRNTARSTVLTERGLKALVEGEP